MSRILLYGNQVKEVSSMNSSEQSITRRHIVFSGNVQGVGFRYRAYHAAQSLRLTGWVRNEWDGTVEMEVQGSPDSINISAVLALSALGTSSNAVLPNITRCAKNIAIIKIPPRIRRKIFLSIVN